MGVAARQSLNPPGAVISRTKGAREAFDASKPLD